MKKLTMVALSIIVLNSLSACATTTESSDSLAKKEISQPQAADTKVEAPKVVDTQKNTETQPPAIGKRSLKLPNAASDKPADKASICAPDENGEIVCR